MPTGHIAERVLVWASALVPAALLLLRAFEWSVVDVVSVFGIFFIDAAVWLAMAGCTIWALVHAIRGRRRGRRAARPFLVCFSASLLAVFFPFTHTWLNANYHWLRPSRMRVVEMVEAGALRSNSADTSAIIALPPGSPHVSMGGNDIIVESHDGRRYVFFFTFRGILDNYSGFLFVPDGGDPRRFGDLGEENSTQLVAYDEHWYFAAHR